VDLFFAPLSEIMGAIATGSALDAPFEDETARRIRDALDRYGILLVRGREITPDDQVRLGRALGPLADHPFPEMCLPERPEIVELAWDGGSAGAGRPGEAEGWVEGIPWHTDLTYLPTPSRAALLHAVEIPPEGGETCWINTADVYDALPPTLRKDAEGQWVVHDIGAAHHLTQDETASYGGMQSPGDARSTGPRAVVQPLVWDHPTTGRRLLNISPLLTVSVVGWERRDGDRLLEALKTFATQDRFAYRHRWQVGDLMIWDNWQTMHSVTPFLSRFRRRMHRVTLAGTVTTGRYLDDGAAPSGTMG
jgi:taurine dioxygenase